MAAGIRFNELQIERKRSLADLYKECTKLEYLVGLCRFSSFEEAKKYTELGDKISSISDILLRHISQLE